jgi:hypothetical protein
MNTLVVGKNSSIGLSLLKCRMFENLFAIDRGELEDLMVSKAKFRGFLEKNRIEKVIYLMVDRSTSDSSSKETSTINYSYPIRIWEVVNELPNINYISVGSIFANDKSMVEIHPYLETQNLAHSKIMEMNTIHLRYSRLYLSQLYGTRDFLKHQPFLYKLNDTIKSGYSVELINGHETKRNFLNVRDVCRVLADSRSWISNPNVSLLAELSFTWLEIAQQFKSFYESNSTFTNIVDPNKRDSRIYNNDNLLSLTGFYRPQNLNEVIMGGDFG